MPEVIPGHGCIEDLKILSQILEHKLGNASQYGTAQFIH